MQLYQLTISDAHNLLKKKKISSRELTRAVFDRIEAVESKVDAFITLAEEDAMAQAEQADRDSSGCKRSHLYT
jgi:aspartyl-tRNA(Asn)/glutamyl-tRNA(Gln) amidotransferase subunit A